jgi:hypothetical protein
MGHPPSAVDHLIQKYSNRSRWDLAPNGLTQSNIGIKGNEPLTPGWALFSICRPDSILIPCIWPTPQVLTATLSDNTSAMLVGKYSNGPLKLFCWIRIY